MIALLTGASGGLGSVVTRQFLDAGHQVCAAAVDWPRHLAESDSCLKVTADLRQPADAESAVRATLGRWTKIDAVVHMAGGYSAGSRVEDTGADVWDEMLAVNLRTAVNVMRAAIPVMRGQGSGRIIVVGATSVLQPVIKGSAFSASMAAVADVVRVASAELRETGVTVNAILPSTIGTDFVVDIYGAEESEKYVDPRSIGSLMLWLCSEAGRDVTGAMIPFIARQSHPCFHWHGVSDRD